MEVNIRAKKHKNGDYSFRTNKLRARRGCDVEVSIHLIEVFIRANGGDGSIALAICAPTKIKLDRVGTYGAFSPVCWYRGHTIGSAVTVHLLDDPGYFYL